MTEWINIIGGIAGIGALFVAWKQLSKIAKNQEIATKTQQIAEKQLIKIAENQRMDILKVVLEIESRINERKVEFDKSATNLRKTSYSNPDDKRIEIDKDYFLAMKESYFNALDRLCFCIRSEYIPERDWQGEYRNMLRDTISKYKDDFGENSPYRNMIELNRKWQDSVQTK